MILTRLVQIMVLGLPMQSGEDGYPSDIIEATGNAVAKVPTSVIVILVIMVLAGVIILGLKARGASEEDTP